MDDDDADSCEDDNDDDGGDNMEVCEENIEKLTLQNEADAKEMMSENGVTSGELTPSDSNAGEVTQEEAMEAVSEEESVFKLTIGSQSTYSADGGATASVGSIQPDIFMPSPRMNALMAVKNGELFLYGGMFEAGDRQYTFSDFYSIDIHKLDEWKIIIENSLKDQVGL